MGKFRVRKGSLRGEITVPPSKSQTLRAILFGAMGHGKSFVRGALESGDVRAMIAACGLFGAKIENEREGISIEGVQGQIGERSGVIDAGNSGIVLRFCTAIGSLGSGRIVVTGDESIRSQRPMGDLIAGLRQLGVSVVSEKGFAPVHIQGPIRGKRAVVVGEDSQPVSALLIASAFAENPIEICVENAGEKPWVGLTLDWFDRLRIPYRREGFARYLMQGKLRVEGFDYTVPGDLSTAAFPIAAALITGSEVVIKNVDLKDAQGDKELIRVFQRMGAIIEVGDQILHVRRSGMLKGVKADINDFVDGLTILAVVACFAEGETHIYNGAVARQKECNRIACISQELKKMGADVEETTDGLKIRRSDLKGAHVDSHHDHRMALSLVVAGLGAEGETIVSPVACIAKTFPTFLRDFNKLGAQIEEIA